MDEDVVVVDRSELSVVTTPADQVVSVVVATPTVITEEMVSVVVAERTDSQVISAGQQGPAGPPGASATAATYTAASTLSGHRMVLLNSQHKLEYASNQTVSHARQVVGMTAGAIMQDEAGPVVWNQEVQEPSWAWDIGGAIYLAASGGLTQVPPTTPAAFSLVVGFATAADRMFVSVGIPIILT